MRSRRIIILLLSVLLGTLVVNAQIVINGAVEKSSGIPLLNSMIEHYSGGVIQRSVTTDSLGRFSISLNSLSGNLIVSSPGYETEIFQIDQLTVSGLLRVRLLREPHIFPDHITTGTDIQRNANEVPFRSSIVYSEKNARSSKKTVADLIMLETGVYRKIQSVESGVVELRSEGLPARYTTVLEDGLPAGYGVSVSSFLSTEAWLGYDQIEYVPGNPVSRYSSAAAGTVNLVPLSYNDDSLGINEATFSDPVGFSISHFNSRPTSFGGWSMQGMITGFTPKGDFDYGYRSGSVKSTWEIKRDNSLLRIAPMINWYDSFSGYKLLNYGLTVKSRIGSPMNEHVDIGAVLQSSVNRNRHAETLNQIFVMSDMNWNWTDDVSRYLAGISIQNVSITGLHGVPQSSNFGFPEISTYFQNEIPLSESMVWLGTLRWTAVNTLPPLMSVGSTIKKTSNDFSYGFSGQYGMKAVSFYDSEFAAFEIKHWEAGSQKLFSEALIGLSVFAGRQTEFPSAKVEMKISLDFYRIVKPVSADHISVEFGPLEVISEKWNLHQSGEPQDFSSLTESVDVTFSNWRLKHILKINRQKTSFADNEKPIYFLPDVSLNHSVFLAVGNWQLTFSHIWMGQQLIPSEPNGIMSPSYSGFDAGAEFSYNRWTVYAEAENLTNQFQTEEFSPDYFYKTTEIVKNDRVWGSLKGRSFLIGCRIRM